MSPYKSVQIRPEDGGALMTNVSSDKAGIANYTVKREFRRYMDREIRAEGYDYFWPNTGVGPPDFSSNPSNQPFPNLSTQKTAATITHSTVTATVTITAGHSFVNGETVNVSGANESAYNGAFIISNVTRTTFQYTMLSNPPGNATGTLLIRSDMPFNLVHLARRPNGDTAVIVGTPTTLFRYFALGSPSYYDSDYFLPSGTDLPYYQGNPGDWVVIGQGFSPTGNRWEAVDINGYAIFNNGVDLPVTYRIEESGVVPIYELRENGIAAVGTIVNHNGILRAGDISEIFQTKMADLFGLLGSTSSGGITGTQAGNTVTASASIFDVTMVGKTIVWVDGTSADITAYDGSSFGTKITVNGAARSIVSPGMTFKIRTKASQAGAIYSGLVTGTITGVIPPAAPAPINYKVIASSAAFNGGLGFVVGMVGKTLRFQNGWKSVIDVFTDSTHVTLHDPAPLDISQPFYVTDATALLVSTRSATAFFTPEMVGSQIIWDTGEVRMIVAYVSASQVSVDSDYLIAQGLFSVQNNTTYAAYTQTQFINRIGYRLINSMNDEPRRWGAVVPGSITSGTNIVTLDYPVKSFSVGDSVTILGSGVDGGNQTVTITGIGQFNQQWLISENALTTVVSADIERTDAINSIIGDYDLQDDGSSIIKMMMLSRTLVIYKDTSIFLSVYTGDVTNPFSHLPIFVPDAATLFLRNTLINVNTGQDNFHLYAGKNSFWRFDLVSQMPKEFMILEVCSNLFFSQATFANRELIFSADNTITREVFIVFPITSGSDRILRYDYKQGTVSTSAMLITAAMDVKNPLTATGVKDDIFVMAVPGSATTSKTDAIVVYGNAPSPQVAWGNVKQIWYRRSVYQFDATKGTYDSNKDSGMDAFGDAFNEKQLRSYVPILSSLSAVNTGTYSIKRARNSIASPTVYTPSTPVNNPITDPVNRNLISNQLLDIYFGDRLLVSGKDNPFEVAMTIWEVDDIRSKSETRK